MICFKFECRRVEKKRDGCPEKGSRFVVLYSSQFSEAVGS